VPVIVTTVEAVSARDVLRCLTGPVRGVVTLAAPPTTWACAIAGVMAGGYAVDPALTRELVLLAAVGTPYGPRPLGLTAQQQRILELVATGLSNRAIAGELGISPDTVKTHLAAAMRLLDAGDRVEAAQRLAAARGRTG
jgi:DNA-binding NarL/FixJ family response regulator